MKITHIGLALMFKEVEYQMELNGALLTLIEMEDSKALVNANQLSTVNQVTKFSSPVTD